MFAEVADVRQPSTGPAGPPAHGERAEVVVVPPSEGLKDYVESLGGASRGRLSGSGPTREDNMLKVTGTVGFKAALDLRTGRTAP